MKHIFFSLAVIINDKGSDGTTACSVFILLVCLFLFLFQQLTTWVSPGFLVWRGCPEATWKASGRWRARRASVWTRTPTPCSWATPIYWRLHPASSLRHRPHLLTTSRLKKNNVKFNKLRRALSQNIQLRDSRTDLPCFVTWDHWFFQANYWAKILWSSAPLFSVTKRTAWVKSNNRTHAWTAWTGSHQDLRPQT